MDLKFDLRKEKETPKTFSMDEEKSKWESKNFVYPFSVSNVFCLIGWDALKLGPSKSYSPLYSRKSCMGVV